MALFINPDGTISNIEVEYDSAGRMSVKKQNNTFETSRTEINPHPVDEFPKKRKKKRKLKKQDKQVSGGRNTSNDKGPIFSPAVRREPITPKAKIPTTPTVSASKAQQDTGRKSKPFLSIESIDTYFRQRKLCKEGVPKDIYRYAQRELKGELWEYFKRCHDEHEEFCRSLASGTRKNAASSTTSRATSYSGGIISGSATSSTSRKPKYGYARDRFGRIQERDHLDEERRNEFRQAQRRQSGYDYSGYDAADDHDSYYDSPGYD